MSGGIWELRRDEITGWWSATVVDREYAAARFTEERLPVARGGSCENCAAAGSEVSRRMLRQGAFHSVGTRSEAIGADDGLLTIGDVDRAGSWSALIAPVMEHGELDKIGRAHV